MEYVFSKRSKTLEPSPIRESMKFAVNPGVISFAQGNPSPETFPLEAIKTISAYLWETNPAQLLQYGTTEGYGPLRKTLKERMATRSNCGRDFDELVIVSGAQQAVELSVKVLCDEGDTVLCENPSFIGSINAFKSYNVNLRGIPVEDDGIHIEALEKALKEEKNVRILYLIPNFQNPLGITMSLEKRKKVYELAKRYGFIILEDNPYGELRFKGKDIPNIKAFDEEGLVIYAGSFSKVFAAGIRVGYVLAPKPIVQKMVIAKQASDVHTNLFWQAAVDRFMCDYPYEGHIEKLRRVYSRKCALMIDCLKEGTDGRIHFNEPEGGLFIWCDMTAYTDMPAFYTKLRENGVTVVPGNMLAVSPDYKQQSFRLNFSTPSDENIVKGVGILTKTLKSI